MSSAVHSYLSRRQGDSEAALEREHAPHLTVSKSALDFAHVSGCNIPAKETVGLRTCRPRRLLAHPGCTLSRLEPRTCVDFEHVVT